MVEDAQSGTGDDLRGGRARHPRLQRGRNGDLPRVPRPADGEPRGRLRGRGGHDVVEWYDRDTFDLQARVDLASLALDPFPTAGAPTDAGLVIAAFDRAWLLDRDGAVASSVSLSRKLVAPWRLDELDGSGRHLVLQGVDTTTLLTVRDGRLEELWTRRVVPIGSLVDYEQTILTVQGWGERNSVRYLLASTFRGQPYAQTTGDVERGDETFSLT